MTMDTPKPDAPIDESTDRPLVEPAEQVVAPDPLDEVRPVAACLPNDADDTSDAGQFTTDHENEGWKAEPLAKP
ncbi:hypothetical protein [Sphingomonas profundi]|uniref:hypothetical protein n=1 Tax=Alterirhizorhabdus profundi TaxID=2681549 RepID=UPI0012E98AB6|nr:hypothetical protein [Sphingomonas profundi]